MIVHKYRRLEDMREGKDSAMFRMTTRQPSAEAVWTEANIGRQLSLTITYLLNKKCLYFPFIVRYLDYSPTVSKNLKNYAKITP